MSIAPGREILYRGPRRAGGFTVIEMLVVVVIIALLLGILVPGLAKARRQVGLIINGCNQRQVGGCLSLYAFDHDDALPDSVATIGAETNWNWQEPMMMTGYRARSPRLHRSMSAYLRDYVEDPAMLYCTNAPQRYQFLDAVWEAGDAWDNPDTPPLQDPASGTYCFYWNYTGYLQENGRLFRGPATAGGAPGCSTLLISDYFGYDHHRSRFAFASCERFAGAVVTPGTPLSSAYWSRLPPEEMTKDSLMMRLTAMFVDGHVERYGPSETTTMRVIWKTDTNQPYPPGLGPGEFYLPQSSLP